MRGKTLYCVIIMVLIIVSVVAYFLVPGNPGQLQNRGIYDGAPKVSGNEQTLNRHPGGQLTNQQNLNQIPQAPYSRDQKLDNSLINQKSQDPDTNSYRAAGNQQIPSNVNAPVGVPNDEFNRQDDQAVGIQEPFRAPEQLVPIQRESIDSEKDNFLQRQNDQIAPPINIEQKRDDRFNGLSGNVVDDREDDHLRVQENPNAVPHAAVDQPGRSTDTQRSPYSQTQKTVRYEANWDSLDARPLPSWYDEAKFGIFIHWGVFSVPAFGSEWFWYDWQHHKNETYVDYVRKNYWPGFKYPDFAPKFTAEFFNATEWADLFEAAGAKYVVLTSKHHEGFTNWPSKVSFNWNSLEAGPGKDLVGELASAVKAKEALKFGVYHSLYEWFNPLYLTDKQNKFQTQYFVASKVLPCLYELVNMYEPEIIWSDGDWEAPDTYWNSTDFLSWLYNESPVKNSVVTNDRWGKETRMKHGGFYNGRDRFNPGNLLEHKWENCMTIDEQSWGFRKNAPLSDYFSIDDLIDTLAETVSCGGNLLMNIGPTAEGRIAPIYEERLRQMGSWLRVNGEAIYSTKPWRAQNDTLNEKVWYTSKRQSDGSTAVYAIVLDWPKGNMLNLGIPVTTATTTVTMLGLSQPMRWTSTLNGGLSVMMPPLAPPDIPCYWAWVLKLTNVR